MRRESEVSAGNAQLVRHDRDDGPRGHARKCDAQLVRRDTMREPEEGQVLATTCDTQPFVTVDIDPAVAERAKHTYPRYVKR